MRCVAAICALMALGLTWSAAAQVYPYTTTIAVPGLISPAPAAPQSEPQGLAYDTLGNHLAVAEGSNQIVQLLDGVSLAPVATFGQPGVGGGDAAHLSNPSGVAFDPVHDWILIADTGNDRVQIFNAVGLNLVATLGQTGVAGADNWHFSAPAGVAVDPFHNRILVADTGNDRVQIFDAASLQATGTIGVPGVAGSDNAHLSAPQSVAVDASGGHVLIADTGNGRIQVLDMASFGYLATIGQVGAVSGLAVDGNGRNLFASDAGDNDVLVIQADTLATTSYLGLIDSFGADNARFIAPGGVAFDPATGRIFAGDSLLNRIQVFGQPSWLSAAVAPSSRAVQVGQSATIFATMINSSPSTLNNCRISLPSNAPPGLTLGFQPTDPSNNLVNGPANQPVSIPPGQSQSFVLTLSSGAPISDPGQSFLFTCDGSTPALIYAGINTADLTFSSGPTADVIAAAATPLNSGTISVPESNASLSAFAAAAFNLGSSENLLVSADSGSLYPISGETTAPGYYQTLPLKVLICETNLLTGQCLSAPAATVPVSFPAGSTATFTVFVAATGTAIPAQLSEPRLYLRFMQNNGGAVPDTVGSTSVAVTVPSSTSN